MRLLRRLTRSPLAYWATVAALGGFTALTVSGLVGRARAEAARYGHLRPAVVAARPLEAGAVVRPADVVARTVPAAFLPDGAVPAPAAAVGRTVVVPILRGAAVAAANLAPDGLRGLAALLPPGTRAIAVPTGAASVALHRGDRVDVLVTLSQPATPSAEPTFAVAEAALVVDVGPESAAVAVSSEEARRVAYAVAQGTVTLTVTAGPAPVRPPAPGAAQKG